VEQSPFLIGRQESNHLHLASNEISRQHAEIALRGGTLWIRDLDSTNGTFLNHKRLDRQMPLARNDILHFGSLEFRVSHRESEDPVPRDCTETGVFMAPPELPEQFVQCDREFEELLAEQRVVTLYQPIVNIATGGLLGCELLGRGDHPDLPVEPSKLFHIAERLGKGAELSRLFRDVGIPAGAELPSGMELFFNDHPSELSRPDAISSLERLRTFAPDQRLVLEISEKTVTDLQAMRELRSALDDLGIGLAYDDFGAGQARLLELIEVPPDYLKFDAFLMRDLDKQSERFHRALQALVVMSRDLGVIPLAEGVETREELAVCETLGFEVFQGFLFGRPAPFAELQFQLP
jgi:EAL domain-containing protein (putative c-di-GMP-specific phosphodiesterase class I)